VRGPLSRDTVLLPEPGPRQVLLRVRACGVCRTDLHIIDGELAGGKRPLTPGHEIVGTVVATGADAERYCVAIPERYDDAQAAPLLCAGLIGYRSYVMTGDARRIGLCGFGAAVLIPRR
jgi:alcohol dehydrogenase, propanol-preferring